MFGSYYKFDIICEENTIPGQGCHLNLDCFIFKSNHIDIGISFN